MQQHQLTTSTIEQTMKNNFHFHPTSLGDGGRSLKRVSAKFFWKGGTPGLEFEWTVPSNWHNRCVPGWFDFVVISPAYTFQSNYPVISSFVNDIAGLKIEKQGRLTIAKTGRLCIDGLNRTENGLINMGRITVWGELTIQRTLGVNFNNQGVVVNFGSLAFDRDHPGAIICAHGSTLENHGEFLFLTI